MQIAVQPGYPSVDVMPQFLNINSLHGCTLHISKVIAIVRQLLTDNVDKYGQHLILQ